MDADTSGSGELRALFVDSDGRLGPVTDALATLSRPVSVRRVDSLSAAAAALDDDSFDCVVLLDAPVADDRPAVDGVEQSRQARETLQSIPIVLYSLDCDHERLERIMDADVPVVSAPPERPALIYRRLRHAAGMERHFQSDRDLLQSLLEYYPHHIFLKDDTGRFEAVSESTAREYGFTRDELVGLTDYEVLDPETARETYAEEQALLDSGESTTNRIDHWIDDAGRHRWVSITKAPRYDESGDPIGIVGSSRDVTEEKRREQMVREVHEASRRLVRAERKRDISAAAMSLAEDIPVFSTIEVALVDPETGELEPVADGDASLFDRHGPQFAAVADEGEARYVATDGTALTAPGEGPLDAAILPLPEHGALGLSADAETFTDFGLDLANILASNLEAALDRAERERELARQNERLEEFASIVSHDLRNPLNVASAATELLAEETDSEHVDRVRNALERMDDLIDALLTLAREGKIVGETEFVGVAAAARDAWAVVDTERATLTVEDDGYVAADPDRLTELFENLFRNSVEHGPTDGRSQSDDAVEHGGTGVSIRVGVRPDGDGFYVADDGTGIDPDARDRLFEMGYSTDSSGTGYGLYIVSTIAEAHGWEVSAGDSDGGGARFDIHGTTVTPEEDLAR